MYFAIAVAKVFAALIVNIVSTIRKGYIYNCLMASYINACLNQALFNNVRRPTFSFTRRQDCFFNLIKGRLTSCTVTCNRLILDVVDSLTCATIGKKQKAKGKP